MTPYPPDHHPVLFLITALRACNAEASFHRDEYTEGLWGGIVNGKPFAWLIDDRHAHEKAHEHPAAERLMRRGGLVMHAQKRDVLPGARWLPIAATPTMLDYAPQPKTREAVFVGYVRDMGRGNLLICVGKKARLTVAEQVFGREAAELYNSAIIGVNVPTLYGSSADYDINMRVTEIMVSGTCLMTNHLPELEEMGFIPDVHLVTYADADDAARKAEALVNAPYEAAVIAQRGQKLVLSKHLYAHRAQQVLEWLDE